MLSGGGFDESFSSTIMAYYTEKARKKESRKQRTAGAHSKGMFSRIFAMFRHKKTPHVQHETVHRLTGGC